MNIAASVAVQSMIKEPIKHAVNAASGTAGVSVAPDWLAITVGITSILTGLVIIYKTYQDIQINCKRIEKIDKRKQDRS